MPTTLLRRTGGYHASCPVPSGFADTNYPSLLKAIDINKRTGELQAYLTVYNNDDGTPFIDPYNDIIAPGSFTKTIAALDSARRAKDNPWLCPHLWQHDRAELIGGVKALTPDSRGVIYVSQLVPTIRRAQETLDLAEQKMLGSSYGYDAELFDMLPGDIRCLTGIKLREVSSVSFPANDLAQILSVKGRYTSYPTYQKQDRQAALAALDASIANLEKHAPVLTPYELNVAQSRARAEARNVNDQAFYQNSRFGPRLGGQW